MKGIIHFHSQYSYDSILSVSKIARLSVENDLEFAILTDHNTINGSLSLKDYIKKNKLDIIVPIAAEYQTEYGDIIAAFIKEEIEERSFLPFIQRVKDQNGLLFLPHPYFNHKRTDFIAEYVDFIEVFNSRKDQDQNMRAFNLARKHNKKTFFGSDAHSAKDLMNAIISIDRNGYDRKPSAISDDSDLKTLLLESDLKCLETINSKTIDIVSSQYVKAFKTKNPKLFFDLTRSVMNSLLRKVNLRNRYNN
jgi:predicted metal-dependent phosphoesterase TrpH